MKILVCIDGSEHSKKAVLEAVKLTKGRNDHVDLLNVYSADMFLADMYTPIQVEQYQAIRKVKQESGTKILSDAAKIFADSGISVNTILEEGHPAQAILEHAKEGSYDIVILGSRGLGGLAKTLLGSVSNAVIQEAKTNILVVK